MCVKETLSKLAQKYFFEEPNTKLSPMALDYNCYVLSRRFSKNIVVHEILYYTSWGYPCLARVQVFLSLCLSLFLSVFACAQIIILSSYFLSFFLLLSLSLSISLSLSLSFSPMAEKV
jgi:hypothetical protein